MKVVICGSYGNLEYFEHILRIFQEKYGKANVFPDDKHLERSRPCIYTHHVAKQETSETIIIRARLMQRYFDAIDDSNLVIVINEKSGQEYYGVGTTLEVGYAHAKRKKLLFTREPTNANILSLIEAHNKIEVLCV